jgi:hypothetical protein
MFTMMNEARLMVGMQGLGLAEMAYQESLAFARERLQGRSLAGPTNVDGPADPIIVHPDVRRMLIRQKVLNEGMRALALFTGYQLDLSIAHPDPTARQAADDLVQLMTPVVKAFLTDEGFNNSNVALQVLGGSGFTTDWPLEQLVRDGRIARIYEGTNGIQALQEATMWIATNGPEDPEQAGAAATPYLRLMALTVIAYLWSRMATVAARQLEAGEGSSDLLQSKLVSAQYCFDKLLPESDWLLRDIQSGKDSMMALSDEQWTA